MRTSSLEDRFTRRSLLRRAGLCLMTVALAGGLSACGKKSRPKPPSGGKAPYPRTYPSE